MQTADYRISGAVKMASNYCEKHETDAFLKKLDLVGFAHVFHSLPWAGLQWGGYSQQAIIWRPLC